MLVNPEVTNLSSPLPGEKDKRRRFSAKQKVSMIMAVKRKMENEGLSCHCACDSINIHFTMYLKWLKKFDDLKGMSNKSAKSLCKGRDSAFLAISEDLLWFIFEMREQGMPMSIRLVALKAAELDPKIAECNTKARYEAARRFVIKHGNTYWLGTNVSQRSPLETAAEALAFMVNVVQPKVNERN